MGNVSPEDDFPGRLLHQAALWDNAELLEDLLHGEQIAHINSQDSWGRTPLHAAATTDNSHCLGVLLQAGADPNIACGPRGDNRTPLHVSSEHGYVSNVKLLLAHGADLVARDNSGLTPLDIAEKCEHMQCMLILKQTADAKETSQQKFHAALRDACAAGEVSVLKSLLQQLGSEAQLVVNMAPSGSNTLLFLACEMGRKEIVKALLEHNADGRIHPVTKYSPLYIACYNGRKDIVELLLKRFPGLVQQHTVERWLPIHACCINGHVSVMELLLKFPYPSHLMQKFRDPTGEWEYEMPFDLNMKDVSGQNVVYVASFLGNYRMVDMLLKFRVKASRIKTVKDREQSEEEEKNITEVPSPTRRRISDGIISIMTRLNLSCAGVDGQGPGGIGTVGKNECHLSPLQLNVYCNNNCETALHAAVRSKHADVAGILLQCGADPNIPCRQPDPVMADAEDSVASSASTALVEACRNRDIGMADLLLRHSARDDDCKALHLATCNKDDILIAKLLSIKAYPDPEYKLNKAAMTEDGLPAMPQSGLTSLTYSSLFPNTSVMINWHNQQCDLSQVRKQWLVDAALNVNPKLKLNPRNQDIVLYAITRIDLSKNSLTWLPPIIFQLPSLRYLNVAQNKIEKLPPSGDRATVISPARKLKTGRGAAMPERWGYTAPVLEEVYLQDNRLDQICEEVFMLPLLVTLDVSNNKLHTLPYNMWKSPKLKELNAAFNLLRELPTNPSGESQDAVSTASSTDSGRSGYQYGSGETVLELSGSMDISVASDNEGNSTSEENLLDAHTLHTAFVKSKSVQQLDVTHHNIWSRSVEVTEQILHHDDENEGNCSQLSALNLAHNQFTSVPVALSCLAVNLTRLNLSYNSLRSMSHITSYPSSLKQLDLSHNQICCWPSLPQVEGIDSMEQALTACYAPADCGSKSGSKLPVLQGRRSLRSAILNIVCSHRRHLRLDNLRTLVLADNNLSRIQLSTDDDGASSVSEEEESEWDVLSSPTGQSKTRFMFPNLSMLDISNNQLREIPNNIHELNNLSVLNISGNLDICELPSQMGLLSRLWNLNTRGCNLQEPLKSMIDSKKYKTMDVIGYLKSVLEDARPYARMKLMIVGVQGIGKTSLLEQLRQEGVGTFKKKPVEHWAKRMGNKNINVKTSRGTNMSTVGVDIGDWVYEKKIRGQSSYGPVVFRTWDFGGQREYYATHQYFLSKRSLYLVVWRIPDRQRGISEILHWLVNIQARAPNSPVLIVGTHFDMMREYDPASISEDLQQIIRDKFINIVDAEKCGLPRVLDTIEVSCKTRHNIKLLCNLIYDTVFSLRPPGSKELLLEQRVPASYLALEDVVSHLAADRRHTGVDPVLNAEQYKAVVTTEMQYRYQRKFRDAAELHQATLFLHENGVLLHYDDATLKDLYFLDPQWLCDMLAHVVTIREINPFARTGVMKLDDLKHVFKSSSIGPVDTRGYIVNLLNKFEVALTWDSRTLLIPSLLPSEESMRAAHTQLVRVKIPVRSRGWAVRSKKLSVSTGASTLVGNSLFYTQSPERFQLQRPSANTHSPMKISGPSIPTEEGVDVTAACQCEITHRSDPECSIRRLLLMSYFPSGFWSRLITRILSDDAIVDIVRAFFIMPKEVVQDTKLTQLLDVRAEWILWQTGIELRYADTTLFRMKEVLPNVKNSPVDYRQLRVRLKQEGVWGDVDLLNSSILEIFFPVDTVVIKRPITDELGGCEPIGYQAIVLDPSPECTAQLLALTVDHIDILLEDWYPTLGTRFVHTSEGRFLVTRLVPCPRCMAAYLGETELVHHQHRGSDSWNESSVLSAALGPRHVAEAFHRAESESHLSLRQVRKSQESYTSDGDGDSGVGPDSTGSSRMPSVEGHPGYHIDEPCHLAEEPAPPVHFSWVVEECILAAYDHKSVTCPSHGDIPLAQVAPDTIFFDLGERHLIRPDNIKKGHLLGRGAFGFVFKGTCKLRGSNTYIDVAMKMLQPVQPGANARQSAIIAYKAAQGKWDRDPLQYACKAYCTARQELNILLNLRHPNIVPLVGVCTRPLALVLDLAPQGALDTTLRHYRRSGARIGPYCLQAIILQVAKAIEYLHQQRIIYRDLKSENVLVWHMPPPFHDTSDSNPVHIKLADYGISRLTLPSGTKGFGGTEGFMAPEIMRYNGEEEYTEKVDCFSFGMFIYELLTLHQPFEGHESVKECILEGGRPPLTYRETLYPSYMLDLMVLCWSQSPRDRPSASQIVSIASAPEFTHLSDTVSLNHPEPVVASAVVSLPEIGDDSLSGAELWLACSSSRTDLLLATHRGWLQYCSLSVPDSPTAACLVGHDVWLGDRMGQIHAYMGRDCRPLFSYALDPEAPEPCAVSSLVNLPKLQRVAVGLTNGRLFLVRSDISPTSSTMGEGSFVMTELGSSTVLHSLTAVFKDQGRICELWCGESNGSISIFTIRENIVTSHEIVNHYEPMIENINVLNLVSTHCPMYHKGDDVTVCSYVYPGCVVYQWDPTTHNILNKLDCSKLVPCSESLKSISIEEHLSPGKCQVTSMAILNTELYIGTTWGCIVVAERLTMRPITVFRPFEEEVRAIVPLLPPAAEDSYATSDDITVMPADSQKQSCPLIATVGRGYRSLIARYTDMVMTPTGIQSPIHMYCGSNVDRIGGGASEVRSHNMYALLWRAERWAAT
ncbi:leucine-rich repeat serine/threonine-protein kinase 1 isoform X3 [Zootermopsis nevadensis]|uniref:leucine-rich repeat serine/threonine-protein kinase 1 isoform X3 n=1 Tax=Zootermopsis nevadensis TaxID=136037 RepID=UPI000B8EBD09|nr:leucine-rich repeat serine/threonine-protein kinase 1 isoform X3 [Zootermopsis nevadensis]